MHGPRSNTSVSRSQAPKGKRARRTLDAAGAGGAGAAHPPHRARALAAPVMLALVTASVGFSGASCSSSTECQSTRTFFEQEVWSGFMGTVCTKCHTPDGTAVLDSNAKFVLQPSTYPGFIDANLANLTMVSQIQFQGTSELLLKPLGQMNHGGGVVLQAGSTEYKALQELVTRLGTGDTCTEPPNTTLQAITLSDGPTTLRRATLDLAGRLPTAAEVTALTDAAPAITASTTPAAAAAAQSASDAALDTALDEIMTEPAFYTRLREIFNDTLLTDEFLEYNGRAIDNTRSDMYPAIVPYQTQGSPQYTSATRTSINTALAREPLDLIAYIVQNEKPFTDIVGGTYTVVNPFSAIAYGLDKTITFQDPTNYYEFHEAQVTLGTGVPLPHAGVLSTGTFLNRWTTTPTNVDRGRARRIFAFFLATDVLKIATRPVDATTVTAQEDPTRNSNLCTVCHKVIDPVAGGFRGYDDNNYEDFNPETPWHDAMFEPGFGATPMDPNYYGKALQWMGPQVASDPRFAISAVRTVYTAMTGHQPIQYPGDPTDPNFATELAAWTAQDGFFGATAAAFTAGNSNLKLVFKAVIKSPYYRAVSAPASMDAGLLQDIGAGRLLTPEMLDRKITAITGYSWRYPYDYGNPDHWLLQDYDILYGGIDSDSTITRLTTANGIMASVATRMANETSCALTAYDFTNARGARTFFPLVDLTEVPESAGHEVPGSIADIKANIQYLHQYLLAENLELDDPEIDRTYQVFLDTWQELSQSGDTSLQYSCQGQWNPNTGVNLAKDVQITSDPNFTVRSWMSVMSYLLSDYKFLYE